MILGPAAPDRSRVDGGLGSFLHFPATQRHVQCARRVGSTGLQVKQFGAQTKAFWKHDGNMKATCTREEVGLWAHHVLLLKLCVEELISHESQCGHQCLWRRRHIVVTVGVVELFDLLLEGLRVLGAVRPEWMQKYSWDLGVWLLVS